MSVRVRIATPLHSITKGTAEVYATGDDVSSVIDDLDCRFAGLKERLVEAGGELRRFISIYVNGEDIRFLHGKETKLKDGDEILIVPAIAGGADSGATSLLSPSARRCAPVSGPRRS